MASLANAVTFLTLAGVPGVATWTPEAAGGSPRPDDGQFTALQVYGTSGKPQSAFGDKTVELNSTKVVTDSLLIYLTEGPVADIDIDVTDTLTVRLTDVAYAQLYKTGSDTLRPRITDAVFSLSKSGIVDKPVSDTLKPVITETVAYNALLLVTDTLTPVLTESHTLDTSDVLQVSDTLTPVVTEGTPLLSIFNANFALNGSDTLRFSITDAATVRTAGEVDRILIRKAPKGRIRINRE